MSVKLHLSCAVSADGYLDDTAPERAILSSQDDLAAVLDLRAQMDMIVIGAETLRRDNPSLATRGQRHFDQRAKAGRQPHPIKLVITRSGNLPIDRAFFRDGDGEKIILTQTPTEAPATILPLSGDPIDAVMKIAADRGCSDVLIEGGAQVLTLALPKAHTFRLAVSPQTFGPQGHARLFENLDKVLETHPIRETEKLGDTTVHHIDLYLSKAHHLMRDAFQLSERCTPSQSAFAVGAIACTDTLDPLTTGYSRETGPSDHAEEAMLSKLGDREAHTVICTLEPCLIRASKPTGCSQRLVKAGVKRVIYAIREDETFTRQSGLSFLEKNGVELIHLPGFEDWFRQVNSAIYEAS